MNDEEKQKIHEKFLKIKEKHPEIDIERDEKALISFLDYGEQKNNKKEKDLEDILKNNNWKSMTFKQNSHNCSNIYEVISNDGTKQEITGYYCEKCGYIIGTPYEQKINHVGFLSTRIGKEYLCRKCDAQIGEHINLTG